MKIKTRIQLFSTLFLLLILLLVNMCIYIIFQTLLYKEALHKTTAHMEQTAASIQTAKTEAGIKSLVRAYVPADGIIQVMDAKETVLTSTKNTDYATLSANAAAKETEKIIEHDYDVFSVATMPIIWPDGKVVTLVMAENIKSTKEILGILRVVLIAASLLIIIPSYFAGRLLSNVLLSPIQAMINTMEEIQSSGDFKKIVLHARKKDELYQLGATFNNMIALLKTQFERQQQFVSDASHELKTPLTVIESYANMLKRWGKKREDVLEEAVEAIHSEALRMKELTNQMLNLASENSKHQANEAVDLAALALETAKKMAAAYNRDIIVTGEQANVIIQGDPQQIKQLLFILLDNAIKYSDASIIIRLTKQAKIFCEVIDKGVGIAKEDIDHIFERFYRVDKARSRQTGGTGLGLSIAQTIVRVHAGNIRAESKKGEGTKMICSFPMFTK